MIRVALDAMGGDGAPDVPVRAALGAVSGDGRGLRVLLVGDPDALRARLDAGDGARPEITVVPARQAVEPDEPPARSIRRKPDSSIAVGLRLVRDGEADAFVSAGSTGAVMAASVLVLGNLPGVDRPAVGAVVPTAADPVLILDVGANVSSRPRHLQQFAHLGSVYVRELLETERPRVGLLNVGEEEEKGDDVTVAAHRRLRDDDGVRFVGNVEGNRIIRGDCDVVVCDGFVGNVLLKFYESIAGHVVGLLEDAAGGELSPEHRRIRRILDYAEYGGAPLLGVDGVAVICHGASSARAVRNAVGVAARSAASGIVDELAGGLSGVAAAGEEREGP